MDSGSVQSHAIYIFESSQDYKENNNFKFIKYLSPTKMLDQIYFTDYELVLVSDLALDGHIILKIIIEKFTLLL